RPYLAAVFAFSQGITPFLKLTFGIFHDVALVHQGNAFASLAHGIVDGSADEPFGAFDGNRLDADRGGFRGTNTLDAQPFNQESFDACIFRRTGEVFNSGVDIFGVFAENHHIYFTRLFYRRRNTGIPAHRSHTGVEVEFLAQRHIQGANTATYRG